MMDLGMHREGEEKGACVVLSRGMSFSRPVLL